MQTQVARYCIHVKMFSTIPAKHLDDIGAMNDSEKEPGNPLTKSLVKNTEIPGDLFVCRQIRGQKLDIS
jgi:hypothetical protein